MKTTYTCEVCGKETVGDNGVDDWKKAYEHEKECRDKHHDGLVIAEDVNELIAKAKICGTQIVVVGGVNYYKLLSAKYDTSNKQIRLEIAESGEPIEKSKECKE